jgi:hypothetical protein
MRRLSAVTNTTGQIEDLHAEFCRLASQLRRTRDSAERANLLARMTGVWKNVDSLIVVRTNRVPRIDWERYPRVQFFS